MKKEAVKTVGSNVGKFGSAAAGLALGSFAMKKIPAFGPPIVQKTLPGLAGMVAALVIGSKANNQYVKALALGLGLAGFVDVVKKTVGAKLPAVINESLPSLSGIGYVQNYGDYPPSYFSQANTARLQGVNPYALQGLSANPYALQGANPYALQGPGPSSSYLLN